MRDEWLAVARGLKLLHASIKAVGVAALLFIAGVVFLMCCGVLTPRRVTVPLAFAPAAVAVLVGFVLARIGRVHLLKVPRDVPHARFAALAAFTLELVAVTGVGGYVGLGYVGPRLERDYAVAVLTVSAAVALVGVGFSQRLLGSLSDHLGNVAAGETLMTVRALGILTVVPIAFIGAVACLGIRDMAGVCFVAMAILVAMVLLIGALVQYRWALQGLQYSALRRAVRSERE